MGGLSCARVFYHLQFEARPLVIVALMQEIDGLQIRHLQPASCLHFQIEITTWGTSLMVLAMQGTRVQSLALVNY